jgi:hypothetical protein
VAPFCSEYQLPVDVDKPEEVTSGDQTFI